MWPQPVYTSDLFPQGRCALSEVVYIGAGAAKGKTCLYNKSWQESKIIPYSENMFLTLLSLCHCEKNPEIKPAFFMLVHPQRYSLKARGPGAIFRTSNQAAWNPRLLAPGQFSP